MCVACFPNSATLAAFMQTIPPSYTNDEVPIRFVFVSSKSGVYAASYLMLTRRASNCPFARQTRPGTRMYTVPALHTLALPPPIPLIRLLTSTMVRASKPLSIYTYDPAAAPVSRMVLDCPMDGDAR